MPLPEAIIELAASWVEKAKGDLELACAGQQHEPAPGWGIAFHCQQAVERAFKGAITLHNVEVPRTHDVVRLRAALIVLGTKSPLGDREVQALLPYAVDDRYPRLRLSTVSREMRCRCSRSPSAPSSGWSNFFWLREHNGSAQRALASPGPAGAWTGCCARAAPTMHASRTAPTAAPAPTPEP